MGTSSHGNRRASAAPFGLCAGQTRSVLSAACGSVVHSLARRFVATASDDECPQVASWLSRPQSASAGLSGCTSPREGVVTRSQSSAQSTPRHRGDDDLQGGDDSDAMDAEAEAD